MKLVARPGTPVNSTLTSSRLTQLDIDVSKATNSTHVKDYAGACWFQTKLSGATFPRQNALVYVPQLQFWIGVDTTGACYTAGGHAVIAHSVFPVGLNNVGAECIAFDGYSAVVVVGGTTAPGSSKIRRMSIADPLTWSIADSAAATGAQIGRCVHYFTGAGLFVAGYSDGKIETSSDGVSWTSRTVPDANARYAMASNGTICVVINSGNVNTYLTSQDGVSWTQRTLPATPSGWRGIAWSRADGVFMAMTDAGVMFKSADGVAWTAVAATFAKSLYPAAGTFAGSEIVYSLRALSSMWIAMLSGTVNGLMCSVDVGQSWRALLQTNAPVAFAVSEGQIAMADGALYLSNATSLG